MGSLRLWRSRLAVQSLAWPAERTVSPDTPAGTPWTHAREATGWSGCLMWVRGGAPTALLLAMRLLTFFGGGDADGYDEAYVEP